MPEKNVLLEALDARWRRLRKDWSRTRRKYSDDSVHDLRVASRRLIAVLDTLRSLVDDPVIEECRRRVKKSLGALSPLRDVQVQRGYLSKMLPGFPQLKTFQKSLKAREKRIADKVQKLLKKGARLDSAIAKAKKHARDNVDDKAIVGVLDERFGEVLSLAKNIDPLDAKTIHEMRLAFKRFRYTAEVVQQVVKERMPDERLEEIHAFQTMMGDIQDVEVLSARLLKWARKDEKRMEDMKPVLEELERQKQKAIETFMGSAGRVDTFWQVTNESLHSQTRDRRAARNTGV